MNFSQTEHANYLKQFGEIEQYLIGTTSKTRKYLKRLFWASLHTTTIIILASGILSFSKPSIGSAEKSTTVQSSAVVIASDPNLPNPNILVEQINTSRQAQGLPALTIDQALVDLAEARAQDMVNNQYFDHVDTNGHIFYDYLSSNKPHFACENLDLSFAADTNAYVNDWLASKKGHRECLLHADVTKVGVSIKTFMTVDKNGTPTPDYIVVAIQSTQLPQ